MEGYVGGLTSLSHDARLVLTSVFVLFFPTKETAVLFGGPSGFCNLKKSTSHHNEKMCWDAS